MSHPRATASESSSSNFRLIINNALKDYEKRTKENLLFHPLASQLQECNSPGDIIAVLQQQILHQSRSTDERCTKWLDPTINVLLTFSQTVGTVGLVRHALIRDLHSHIYLIGIFTGDGDLCGDRYSPFSVYSQRLGMSFCNTDIPQAAKDVRASQDTLVDVFERIEMFFRRLVVYIDVPPTTEMMDMITQIMVEVLCILGIATKEIRQSRLSEQSNSSISQLT
jgi:hypothetical protein